METMPRRPATTLKEIWAKVAPAAEGVRGPEGIIIELAEKIG